MKKLHIFITLNLFCFSTYSRYTTPHHTPWMPQECMEQAYNYFDSLRHPRQLDSQMRKEFLSDLKNHNPEQYAACEVIIKDFFETCQKQGQAPHKTLSNMMHDYKNKYGLRDFGYISGSLLFISLYFTDKLTTTEERAEDFVSLFKKQPIQQ